MVHAKHRGEQALPRALPEHKLCQIFLKIKKVRQARDIIGKGVKALVPTA